MQARHLVANLVFLAACSAPSSVTPTASAQSVAPSVTPTLDVSSLDPCSLLDAGQLSATLSAQLTASSGPVVDGYRTCAYDDPAASTTLTVLISTTPANGDQGEEIVGQLPQDGRAEELHGVGLVAWFDYCPACPDDGSTTLTVMEPPLEFTLALTLPTPDLERRVVLEELARSVIDDLGL
jgi:hypothetical protein